MKTSVGGNVADLGVHGDKDIGEGLGASGPGTLSCGEYSSFVDAGGTGFRYRSFGLQVNWADDSELMGTSSKLRRWPGRRGQTVVDNSAGSWHSSSPSTLYCCGSAREPQSELDHQHSTSTFHPSSEARPVLEKDCSDLRRR
jgi:hypothetical protein